MKLSLRDITLLHKIKTYCGENNACASCELKVPNETKCPFGGVPCKWVPQDMASG